MLEAVFFDFNGTLLMDHDVNHDAWKQVIFEIAGNDFDFEEFYKTAKSYMDFQAITSLNNIINKEMDIDTINKYCKYKELLYRQLCKDSKKTLINGAIDVLNYLKERKIPVILCTSSIKENVDFYYEYFKLDRWFNKEEAVYDTGEYTSKVEMYKECANRLNVNIKNTITFEDSPKSILEAIKSGCENIIIIKRDDSITHPCIKQIIEDYTKLDYSIFNYV